MKRVRARITNTHVDLHGDRVSVEALRDMTRQISERYLPSFIQHDIRYPPAGRAVSAEVVPLEDGEFGLDAVLEYWEPQDTGEDLKGDGRTIHLLVADQATFAVAYDRSFLDEDGQRFVNELAALAGPDTKPELYVKKALDPISTLLIVAGAFAVGGMANGFFNKLGADLYDALKRRLKEFYRRKSQGDRLVDLQLIADAGDRRFEVHVIVSEPNPQKLEELFRRRFIGLDAVVDSARKVEPDVAKVVVEWREGRMILLYAVRSDGVPTVNGDPNTAL